MALSPPPFPLTLHVSQSNASDRSAPSIFQPPQSPASIFVDRAVATADDYFTKGSSRKRQRSDSQSYIRQQSWTATPSWAQIPTPSDSAIFGQSSSTTFVNERYRLAGGYDTPSILATSRYDGSAFPYDAGRGRLRDDEPQGFGGEHQQTELIRGPLARERNGVARMPSSSNGSPSTWTGLAFNLVGKVFSFGTSVVKGFYAGGGKGYDLNGCAMVGSDLLQQHSGPKPMSTPLPGAWDDGDFDGDFEQDNPTFSPASPATLSRPPLKKRQTDRDSWIVIDTPDPRPATPTSTHLETMSRTNTGATNLSASRAHSRRSLAAATSRRQSHVTYSGSPCVVRPDVLHRRASVAAMRSPNGRQSGSDSPLQYVSPEAERLTRQRAKQERANDRTMSSMSRKMEEMIRQAQEALGTKVEVEGDDPCEDEGYVDEED